MPPGFLYTGGNSVCSSMGSKRSSVQLFLSWLGKWWFYRVSCAVEIMRIHPYHRGLICACCFLPALSFVFTESSAASSWEPRTCSGPACPPLIFWCLCASSCSCWTLIPIGMSFHGRFFCDLYLYPTRLGTSDHYLSHGASVSGSTPRRNCFR